MDSKEVHAAKLRGAEWGTSGRHSQRHMETPQKGGEVGHRGGSWSRGLSDTVEIYNSSPLPLQRVSYRTDARGQGGALAKAREGMLVARAATELWRQAEVVGFWVYPEDMANTLAGEFSVENERTGLKAMGRLVELTEECGCLN